MANHIEKIGKENFVSSIWPTSCKNVAKFGWNSPTMIEAVKQLSENQIIQAFLAASQSDLPSFNDLQECFHRFSIPLLQCVLLDDPTHPKETALTIQRSYPPTKTQFYCEFGHLSSLNESKTQEILNQFLQCAIEYFCASESFCTEAKI